MRTAGIYETRAAEDTRDPAARTSTAPPGGYDRELGLRYARLLAASGHLDCVSAHMGTWTALETQVPRP